MAGLKNIIGRHSENRRNIPDFEKFKDATESKWSSDGGSGRVFALSVIAGSIMSVALIATLEMMSTKRFQTALINAVRASDSSQVVETIKKDPSRSVNFVEKKEGFSPLHIAVMIGNKGVISTLLAEGANPNVKDQTGRTPLHHAISEGSLEVAEMLLQYGANPNARDAEGCTPLCYAVKNMDKDAVKLLLEEGADPDIRGPDGRTPLHFAVMNLDKETVELLVNAGADPNTKDTNGNTPLHLAVMNKDSNIMEILLKHGASLTIRNGDGKRPVGLLEEMMKSDSNPDKYQPLLNLLESYEDRE